jgi:two-component system response regulator BaeR
MTTILIVEDEPKLAALLRDYLRQAGFDTRHIADGAAVVASVQADMPDLVLLDRMLPGRTAPTSAASCAPSRRCR